MGIEWGSVGVFVYTMNTYTALADLVTVIHLAYVLFVILGLVAVLIGFVLKWRWVKNPWFRLIHLSMIAIVVVESLMSITCPLTTLEYYLRRQGGQSLQGGSFVGRMAHELLFFDLPPQVFTVAYCTFGALVLATFLLVPPRFAQERCQGE